MHQLEIKYFFPLTEQIPLSLDYSPCEEYQRQKSNLVSMNTISSYLVTNGLTANTTINTAPSFQFKPSPDSIGYWQVTESIQIWRTEKPSWLHRKYTEFMLGWKWKDK